MIDLNKLNPYVKILTEKFLAECKKQNINVTITQGLRTIAEQNALYAQGRTTSGNIVTQAKGGNSMHNYGLAVDFAPIVNGKIDWNDIALFKKIGKIGLSVGFDSYGGDWTSFKDYPHLQWTGGLSLSDLKSGKVPTIPKEGDDNVEHNTMKLFYSDGTPVKVDNYKIDGSTYVNLRDILSARVKSIKVVQGDKIYLIKQ